MAMTIMQATVSENVNNCFGLFATHSQTLILGPAYLPHIISVLKAQLQRGYQVHILVYTTHAILSHVLGQGYVYY